MIRRLYRLYRPHLGWLLTGVVLALLTLLANIGLLALSGWFIAAMAAAGLAGSVINYFTPAAIIRGLAMLRTAGRYGERLITHEATFRLLARLRSDCYRHIEPLAPAGLEDLHSGELLSRLQKDIDRLDAVYLRILLPLLVAALAVPLLAAFLARHDTSLALLVTGLLAVAGGALPLWLLHRARRDGPAQVRLASRLRTQAVEGIQGMAELIAFGADARHAETLIETSRDLVAAQRRLGLPQALAGAAQGLLAQLAVLGTLLIAVPLLRQGLLAPPELAMLALLALAAFEAVAPLPQAFGAIPETLEAARRVFALYDRPPPIHEPARPAAIPEHGDIRFEGVTLRHASDRPPALQSLDLLIPEGGLTLLQGPSGAGKSSVLELLVRFREPSAGTIRYAGIDLRRFDSERWRSRLAVVSQNAPLIDGTLRDNLCLGRPEADDTTLLAACARVGLDGLVAELPEGLDTWLGETGTRLSGGQARRLAIARALLHDAPILLLDEPTEGLDPTTERELTDTLRPLLQGRTVLLITHRPLDLGHPARIYRLDEGRLLPD